MILKCFVIVPRLHEGNDIISQVEVATSLINCNDRTVAAATGRGFESARPEKFLATDYTHEHRLSVAEKVIRVNPCSSVAKC